MSLQTKGSNEVGKIYFFKTNKFINPDNCFGSISEVNSNFDLLRELIIYNGKALAITSNYELLQWEFEKKKALLNTSECNSFSNSPISPVKTQKYQKKSDYLFLLTKPSYHFHKIKFKSVVINKLMCLGLDTRGNVLVWGKNYEGLLGLGYDVTYVETPTILENLYDITDISMSEHHAVVLNSSGNAFSWGLGKYGELGLERSIYSPIPQQILTDTLYSKVFCSNLITCLLDLEGHFYYFGVIIRQLGGNNSSLTTKSLLKDQNYLNSNILFSEKEIEELENEKFKEIVIGNGFIALLTINGTIFTLEYNEKLTMLYSKYFVYSISVANNNLYGLAKDYPRLNNSSQEIKFTSNQKDKAKKNYYLCKWSSKSSSDTDLSIDVWTTTIWKFNEEFPSICNCKLLSSNNSKNILILMEIENKYSYLNNSLFNQSKKYLDFSNNNNDVSLFDNSSNIPNHSLYGEVINTTKKEFPEKFLEFDSEYDDSFNLKYKRCKSKNNTLIHDLSNNRSKSLSHFTNRNCNNTIQEKTTKKSSLNKVDYLGNIDGLQNNNLNIGNNLSSIGANYSGIIINSSNKKYSTNCLENKSYKHYSTQHSHSYSGLEQGYFNGNKNWPDGKEDDDVNVYETDEENSEDFTKKELNKYKIEIETIINNFKKRKSINFKIKNNDNNNNKDNYFTKEKYNNNMDMIVKNINCNIPIKNKIMKNINKKNEYLENKSCNESEDYNSEIEDKRDDKTKEIIGDNNFSYINSKKDVQNKRYTEPYNNKKRKSYHFKNINKKFFFSNNEEKISITDTDENNLKKYGENIRFSFKTEEIEITQNKKEKKLLLQNSKDNNEISERANIIFYSLGKSYKINNKSYLNKNRDRNGFIFGNENIFLNKNKEFRNITLFHKRKFKDKILKKLMKNFKLRTKKNMVKHNNSFSYFFVEATYIKNRYNKKEFLNYNKENFDEAIKFQKRNNFRLLETIEIDNSFLIIKKNLSMGDLTDLCKNEVNNIDASKSIINPEKKINQKKRSNNIKNKIFNNSKTKIIGKNNSYLYNNDNKFLDEEKENKYIDFNREKENENISLKYNTDKLITQEHHLSKNNKCKKIGREDININQFYQSNEYMNVDKIKKNNCESNNGYRTSKVQGMFRNISNPNILNNTNNNNSSATFPSFGASQSQFRFVGSKPNNQSQNNDTPISKENSKLQYTEDSKYKTKVQNKLRGLNDIDKNNNFYIDNINDIVNEEESNVQNTGSNVICFTRRNFNSNAIESNDSFDSSFKSEKENINGNLKTTNYSGRKGVRENHHINNNSKKYHNKRNKKNNIYEKRNKNKINKRNNTYNYKNSINTLFDNGNNDNFKLSENQTNQMTLSSKESNMAMTEPNNRFKIYYENYYSYNKNFENNKSNSSKKLQQDKNNYIFNINNLYTDDIKDAKIIEDNDNNKVFKNNRNYFKSSTPSDSQNLSFLKSQKINRKREKDFSNTNKDKLSYLISEEKNKKSLFYNDSNNTKLFKQKYNKNSILYFCYLLTNYMKKIYFIKCARKIANYEKFLEKKLSLKIIFRLLRKRLIFYKIKFFHRYKRINKYLIKNQVMNINIIYEQINNYDDDKKNFHNIGFKIDNEGINNNNINSKNKPCQYNEKRKNNKDFKKKSNNNSLRIEKVNKRTITYKNNISNKKILMKNKTLNKVSH